MSVGNLELVNAVASAITAVVTFVGAILVVKQLRQESAASSGQFMLQLREMFSKFDDIHGKLRPGGDWHCSKNKPEEDDEAWIRIDAYMGLFELCEHLIKRKLLNQNDFEDLYLYRLENLMTNTTIVEAKLKHERGSWDSFESLRKRCGISSPNI